VLQGKDAVKTGRKMLGETNPLASLPGSVRGDYGIDVGRNVCHGSDSVESAEREIGLWLASVPIRRTLTSGSTSKLSRQR
jgi:nucleoside diphosphate kinase